MTNQKYPDYTDVGPFRPPGTSPVQRRWEATVVAGWDVDDYKAIEQNLEGLTAGILDMSIDEVLRHFQHHNVGMAGPLR